MQGNPNDYLGNKISAIFWMLLILGAVACLMFLYSCGAKRSGPDTDPKAAMRMINKKGIDADQARNLEALNLREKGGERGATIATHVEWLQGRKAAPTQKAVPGMDAPAEPQPEPSK